MSISPASLGSGPTRAPASPAGRRRIGLEVGGRWLRYARSPGRGGAWSTGAFGLGDPGPAAEARGARELAGRARRAGVPRGTAVCTLASPAIDIFPLHLPPAEPGAMEAQIVAQAQAQLSYPLASAVLDYSVLPESVRRPVSASVPVLVFAAPRELVERLLGRLDAIGLVVERLLTPACVLAPQVCADAIRGRHLLVATGEEATSISVVQEGAVLLERMSPWGTAQLIEQLRDELGLSAGQCRSLLTPDRPEAAGDGTPSGDPSLQSAMQEILGPIFQSLAQETAGCLGYCDAFLNHEPPVSVIVSGALGRHPLLREALGRDLELPLCGALECLPGTGFGSPDEVCTYAAAIGGALWAEGAAA